MYGEYEIGDIVQVHPEAQLGVIMKMWRGVVCVIISKTPILYVLKAYGENASDNIIVCTGDEFALVCKSNEKDSTVKPKFQPWTKVVFMTSKSDKVLNGDIISTSDNGEWVDIYVKKYRESGLGELFKVPVENVRECSNREIGYMEMLTSLITSIDQAGGQIPTERLLKMTVEELIFELGHNNVRFKFDKPVKP